MFHRGTLSRDASPITSVQGCRGGGSKTEGTGGKGCVKVLLLHKRESSSHDFKCKLTGRTAKAWGRLRGRMEKVRTSLSGVGVALPSGQIQVTDGKG